MSGYFEKSPGSQADHKIDWSRRHLRLGEFIEADLGWTVVPEHAGGLSVSDPAIENAVVSAVTFGGGLAGKVYLAEARVETNAGRVLAHTVAVRIAGGV